MGEAARRRRLEHFADGSGTRQRPTVALTDPPAPSLGTRLCMSACSAVRKASTGTGVVVLSVLVGALAGTVFAGLGVFVALVLAVWYDRQVTTGVVA